MPNNYVLLEKIVVPAAGASSVTFANIPQTGYTDLKVVASLRRDSSTGSGGFQLRFNGDTGSNYSSRTVYGNGASAASFTSSGTSMYAGEIGNSTDTASTFPSAELYIPNYLSGTAKSLSSDSVTENNATTAFALLTAGLWTGTAAINSVQIFPSGSGSIAQYSTFYLYGVAALGTTPAIAPKATGGDVIDTDGTYWYHTFRSSGTFTPAVALTCDYLVVAGAGGAGGSPGDGWYSGSGGAGGYRNFTSQTISTAQTVTIGAGGAGGTGSANGTSGSDSVFGANTSTGGGAGGGSGASFTGNGSNGGSAGGGGSRAGSTPIPTGGTGNTPSTSPSQGNNGANGTANGTGNAGTGGGSSGAGNTKASGSNANGGTGTANSITGTSVTYATGGNILNGVSGNGTAGGANTGNGGNGAYDGSVVNRTGGAGGSGIVVVRYSVA